MKGLNKLALTACAAAMLVSASAFAQLMDDERKCDDAFNKAVRNVGNQEQKANRKCIKDGVGDVSACVNTISLKAADKEFKVEGLFQTGEKCDPNAAFGVINTGTPAGDDAAKAAEEGTDDILRALWGDPVNGVIVDDKCADAVAKRTGKIYDTILKAFRKCAKDAVSIASIATLEACAGTAVNDAKVAVFQGKLDGDVVNKCNASAPIVDGTSDGVCGGAGTQAAFSACAGNVAQCNGCLAINAITGGNADCDTLDDGSANGSCGEVCSTGPAFQITFEQLNIQDDAGTVTDSAWGSVDLGFVGDSQILYFNLAVNSFWRVKNIPVLSIEGTGSQTMTYNFDLGVTDGTDVTGLSYDFCLTPTIRTTMPGGALPAGVAPRDVAVFSGEIGETIAASAPDFLDGGAAQEAPVKHVNTGVPNQDCGVGECVPAAISNSLIFVNNTANLGINPAELTIAKMKIATGWTNGVDPGAPVGWWNTKNAYMQANSLPIATNVNANVGGAISALDDDCDVEVRVPGHAAVVVGITKVGGTKYTIDVAHDTNQGVAGGTKTETMTYDTTTGALKGAKWFNGNILDRFVIECPLPTPTPTPTSTSTPTPTPTPTPSPTP